jgi:hypothetical protein
MIFNRCDFPVGYVEFPEAKSNINMQKIGIATTELKPI